MGRNRQGDRLFVNAVFWVLRTGSKLRDLPPDFGKLHFVYMRFSRWRDKGVWERLLEVLCDDAEIVNFAELNGMTAVIPPRSNRRFQRSIDGRIYAARHLVEKAFLKIKKWRALATRYAKTTASFETACANPPA